MLDDYITSSVGGRIQRISFFANDDGFSVDILSGVGDFRLGLLLLLLLLLFLVGVRWRATEHSAHKR